MIEVSNLSKTFGIRKVVNEVSFVVEQGDVLGFLGPNGAGKSTTMRMITGFILPSSGSVKVGGYDVVCDPVLVKEKIGYLPENAPVYSDMSVFQYLSFCAEIRGYRGINRKKKVAEGIEKCFLSEVKNQTVNTLSKGYKQRVCFAQSIIHDPKYLIFDEPTDGLDPNQKHEVRLMIKEMSSRKAIIISTHILEEISVMCSKTIILSNGSIVVNSTPDELKAMSSDHGSVLIDLDNNSSDNAVNCLQKIDGVKKIKLIAFEENNVNIQVYPENINNQIIERIIPELNKNGFKIKSIFIEQGKLDQVFRSLTT